MKFSGTQSLRWRLVAVMCLAYIIAAATSLAAGYRAQEDNLRAQLAVRARSDAAILAAGSGPLFVNSRFSTIESWVSQLKQRTQGMRFAAVVAAGHVYGATSRSTSDTKAALSIKSIPRSPQARTLPDGDVEAIAPMNTEVLAGGYAEVILSSASIQKELRDTLMQGVLVRLLGLGLFLLLSLVIAQYVLGPITTMARAAQAIRQGQLSARVPIQGRAELATVAEAFNDMASALEQRIKHRQFLATAGAVLPSAFRDKRDVRPILQEFCRQLHTSGAALITRGEPEYAQVWFSLDPREQGWKAAALRIAEEARSLTNTRQDGYMILAIPVLDQEVFLASRSGDHPFTEEELEVITNFAYQIGIAADNARLFEAQQEALQVKDQFLSIVSHELRTPLTTIKGYSQMLCRRLLGDPEGHRYAETIDTQVSRLSRLVDDLLDVTRFTRGQFELTREQVDLRPALEDVVSRFQVLSPRHTVCLELDEGSFEGYWDPERLEQVLNNLISNAVKYSPEGGDIVISTRHVGDDLQVSVRDRGIGIAEEDQEQLFERFYRGSAEGKAVKGLGLGLYVTRRIVEAHGGTIMVRSRPGEGSEFTFTLPLLRAPAVRVASG